jgi:hypothetical protein
MNEEEVKPKKKIGRPKGKRDQKPRLTEADLTKAKMLYIAGATISSLKRVLGISSTNIIYSRIEKEGWDAQREEYHKQKEKNYLSAMMEKSKKETDAVLEDLKTIKEKSMEGIANIDLERVRIGEATQSYIGATELERRVRSEGMEMGFVIIVGRVLKEVIQDPKILIQISERLREEWAVYKGRPLEKEPIAQLAQESRPIESSDTN